MKSKIIIHNHTNLRNDAALELAYSAIRKRGPAKVKYGKCFIHEFKNKAKVYEYVCNDTVAFSIRNMK